MHRRHLIKGIGVIALYGTFPEVLAEFLSSCKNKTQSPKPGFFSESELAVAEQLAETLLPATSTPGAIEARVPQFLDLVIKNCLQESDQQLIRSGISQLDKHENFLSLPPADKTRVIRKIDDDAFKNEGSAAWFRIFKKLSLIGYFTSQEGMTKALNYVKVPGQYKACIPYKPGDKALAKTFLMYW